jgi:hypothetical protein
MHRKEAGGLVGCLQVEARVVIGPPSALPLKCGPCYASPRAWGAAEAWPGASGCAWAKPKNVGFVSGHRATGCMPIYMTGTSLPSPMSLDLPFLCVLANMSMRCNGRIIYCVVGATNRDSFHTHRVINEKPLKFFSN